MEALDKLKLARRHLVRVLNASAPPADWDDLSMYGFYCLEAAVEAAALQLGIKTSTKHWEKANLARELHNKNGLPDVQELLRDLNDARKSAAYGNVLAPDLEADKVASQIERYIQAVYALLTREPAQ